MIKQYEETLQYKSRKIFHRYLNPILTLGLLVVAVVAFFHNRWDWIAICVFVDVLMDLEDIKFVTGFYKIYFDEAQIAKEELKEMSALRKAYRKANS